MTWLKHHWRDVLAALPLPMLALAASYGVYSYALLFVPRWVAVAQAAAFELTYIGLAVVKLPHGQHRRGIAISVGAVCTSVVYNTLAGLFHVAPSLLDAVSYTVVAMLATLHGLPLAFVAYLVADLLLHQMPAPLPQTVPHWGGAGARRAVLLRRKHQQRYQQRTTILEPVQYARPVLVQAPQQVASAAPACTVCGGALSERETKKRYRRCADCR